MTAKNCVWILCFFIFLLIFWIFFIFGFLGFLDFLDFFRISSEFFSEFFSGRFDTSGPMIRLSVPEVIKLNSRVVLDGALMIMTFFEHL